MIGLTNSQQGIARGKLLVILLMIAAIGIAAFSLFFMRPSTTEQRSTTNASGYRATGDQFMKALSKNDTEATFNLLTETGKLDVGGRDKWNELVTTSFSKNVSDPTFLSEYNITDTAGAYQNQEPKLLTYKLRVSDANWETSLTIIKDGNSWKIDRISSDIRR